MLDETNDGSDEGVTGAADVAAEPGVVEITATSPGKKHNREDHEVTFKRSFGVDLDESVKMFGAAVVHSIFVAQAVIRAQARARLVLEKGGMHADAIKAGESYTPGIVTRTAGVKKNPLDVLADKIAKGELTQEQLLEELRSRLASR